MKAFIKALVNIVLVIFVLIIIFSDSDRMPELGRAKGLAFFTLLSSKLKSGDIHQEFKVAEENGNLLGHDVGLCEFDDEAAAGQHKLYYNLTSINCEDRCWVAILELNENDCKVLMSDNKTESVEDISRLIREGVGVSCYLLDFDIVSTIGDSK